MNVASISPAQVHDDFWEKAKTLGPKVGHIVLDQIVKACKETTHVVNDLKGATNDIVEEAQKMRVELQAIIERKNITIEHLSDILAEEIGGAYLELRDEVIDPLPEKRSDRARVRAELVDRVLQKVNKAYVRAMVKLGVPNEQAELQFRRVSPKINHVLLVAGRCVCHVIVSWLERMPLIQGTSSMTTLNSWSW